MKHMLLFCVVILTFGSVAVTKPLVYHFDFNTTRLNRSTVERILEHVAGQGYTAVLWEIENVVRFDCCPEVAAPDAFSKEEFRQILAMSRRLGLEPIPLMQTLGHAEYVLRHEKYLAMREQPDRHNAYCPSKPDVHHFLTHMLKEYLDLFGPCLKRFHLGGDEVHGFGSCKLCKGREKVDLYIEHLESLAGVFRARGIRPGIWQDMLVSFDKGGNPFGRVPRDYTIWFWEYYYPNTGHVTWANGVEDAVCREVRSGREVIYCGAVQCAYDDPFFTRYAYHRENLTSSIEAALQNGLAGYCVTSWSIHQGSKELQFPLVDYAARRFRNPGADSTSDWKEIVAAYFEDVSVAILDEMTVWSRTLKAADGRYSGFKDGRIPPAGGIRKRFADKPEEAQKVLSVVQDHISKTEKGVAAIRAAAGYGNSPFLALACEAAELKLLFLDAERRGLTGERCKSAPLERAREFYRREQLPVSADDAAMRAFTYYMGK